MFQNTLFHLHRWIGTYLPMKMEQTVCSETSAHKIQMPENYPEEGTQQSEHGTSLTSSAKLYSWGQSTVVASGWLDWGSNTGGGKGVLFSVSIQTRTNTHSSPFTMGNGVPYLGWSGQRMAWLTTHPPSSTGIKYEQSYTSMGPSVPVMACYRLTFILTFTFKFYFKVL